MTKFNCLRMYVFTQMTSSRRTRKVLKCLGVVLLEAEVEHVGRESSLLVKETTHKPQTVSRVQLKPKTTKTTTTTTTTTTTITTPLEEERITPEVVVEVVEDVGEVLIGPTTTLTPTTRPRLNNRGNKTRGFSNNRGGNNNNNNNMKRNNNNNNNNQKNNNNNNNTFKNFRSNKFNRGTQQRRNLTQQRTNNAARTTLRGAATMLQDQNTQVRQLQLLAKNQQLLQKQLQQLQNIQSRQNELLLSSSSSSRYGGSSSGYRDDRDLLHDRDVLMF